MIVEEWQLPPKIHEGVPDISPGTSAGKVWLSIVLTDLELPPGTVVRSCNRLGATEWTVVAKIDAELANGESKSYFLKCAEYIQGRAMLEGEFTSMNELYKVVPNLVPKPLVWGQLTASNPETYYFLCDFLETTGVDPDPVQLCTKLVALHKGSVSPTGMFGFPINPLRGNLPLQTKWNPSWVDFFIQLFRGTLSLDQRINGLWKDLGQFVEVVITDIVPQVLGPLEADGKSVKPSLIHGDLWHGNVGTDPKTGEVYIFDASSYYAHHEMEVAIWRHTVPNGLLGNGVYLKTYLDQMGISEPADQFDDRHTLYSACTALHAAACHDRARAREECYEKLHYLIDKYRSVPKEVNTNDAPCP